MAKATNSVVLATLALLILAGCGARQEYRADHLELHRRGWDSLDVEAAFVRSTVMGGSTHLHPDSVVVSVFDQQYALLYAGEPGSLQIPDQVLGDRERLTVEACGIVNRRQICLQDMIQASPKRLTLDEVITYPSGSDLAEGMFELSVRAERQVFGENTWEPIEASGVEGHLLAWVDNQEAQQRGTVLVPFSSLQGRFDLSRHANYKNFRYYLDSQLLDEQSAAVHFEVYAGLGGGSPERLTVVRKEVDPKTDDDHANDVRYFVEQATERLIDELDSFLGGRRASAFVDDWEYDPFARTYEVDMDAEWEGPVFNRRDYEIKGRLVVGEDGSDAAFQLRSGNRRAVNRWRDRIDGDVLRLGTLDVWRAETAPITL